MKCNSEPIIESLVKDACPNPECQSAVLLRETLQTVAGTFELIKTYRMPNHLPIQITLVLFISWTWKESIIKEKVHWFCLVSELIKSKLNWKFGTNNTSFNICVTGMERILGKVTLNATCL